MRTNSAALIIYPRVSNHASRILKQADFLIKNQIVEKVLILSMYYDTKHVLNEEVSDNISISRLKVSTYNLPKNAIGDSIKFAEFIIRCISIVAKIKPILVIPHSLSVLPIGVWAKLFYKKPLIYDAHELETERYQLKGTRKRISKIMERILIKYCEKVIVVNEHIANWYRKEYQLDNVYSVPNIPNNPYLNGLIPRTSLLRDEFQIPADKIIFIYQGALSKGRGIIELLEIFSSGIISEDRVIVFMGFGEMENEVRQAASDHEQIFYKDAVPTSEVLAYTSSADVGVFFILEQDMCLSYQLSLPNKYFEYTLSGLYLCINDRFPVMQEHILEHKLGSIVASDKESIANFINAIMKDKIDENFTKSIPYRIRLDWSQNFGTLNNIFS
jgi:hypothetical protein